MGTDWNQKKFSYKGNVLSWDKKDDIQRLLTILQDDAMGTLNTVFEYGFVMNFTTEHLAFINKAPTFWAEVMRSLRYTLIMESARLFDEKKRALEIGAKMTRQHLSDGKELDEKFFARVGRRLAGQGYSADTVYFVVNKLRGLKR